MKETSEEIVMLSSKPYHGKVEIHVFDKSSNDKPNSLYHIDTIIKDSKIVLNRVVIEEGKEDKYYYNTKL